MTKDKKIAVVVPAYNEQALIQALIGRVIETMPDFVDRTAGQAIVRTFERYRVSDGERGIE